MAELVSLEDEILVIVADRRSDALISLEWLLKMVL